MTDITGKQIVECSLTKITPELFSQLKKCDTTGEFRIICFLHANGPATREEIVKHTGIKRTTVYDSLVRLQVKEMVTRETRSRGPGRPLVYWSITNTPVEKDQKVPCLFSSL
ncbi:MAG: helix-turn-helix domain-containing protein [Candidatus Hodarchaeales archaeon]